MKQRDTIPGTTSKTAFAVGSPQREAGVRRHLARPSSETCGEVRTSRTATWLAWGLWALSVLLLIGYIPLCYQWHAVAAAPGTTLPPTSIAALKTNMLKMIEDIFAHASYLIYSTLGALIVSRAREQRIGWIFCALGLLFASNEFTGFYAVYALLVVPGSLPAGLAAAWVQHWIWVVMVALLLVFLPLLYPTGRSLSRRWKLVNALAIGLIATGTFLDAFAPGPLGNYFDDFKVTISNPLGIAALGPVVEVSQTTWFPLLLLLTLVGATSLVLRLRRASGNERQQLKWFAYITALFVVSFALTFLVSALLPSQAALVNAAFNLLFPLLLVALPLTTGLAILKYRLYDIDRLINRTLGYGALTACVISVYVLIVGSLGTLFRSSDNPFIAILATGLVALLCHPLRQRVQRAINRVMYGERDNPFAVLMRLGSRLEATLAPDAVLPTIVQTVQEALLLPYVAIALAHGETFDVAASIGKPMQDTLNLPLVYQGETVG